MNNGTLYIIIITHKVVDMQTRKLPGLKSKPIKEMAIHFKTPQHTTMILFFFLILNYHRFVGVVLIGMPLESPVT